MYNNPTFFRGSPEIMLLIIPVVYLFCWLFNAYRLGKFKKSRQSTRGKKRDDRIAVFIVFIFIIAAALAAAALEPLMNSFVK